jgi:hypothetical protein
LEIGRYRLFQTTLLVVDVMKISDCVFFKKKTRVAQKVRFVNSFNALIEEMKEP